MTLPGNYTYAPRPTLYKGVTMRSRLEARVAGFLDRERLSWQYEPAVFADERGDYVPDFQVSGLTRAPLYVDVKGPPLTAADLEAMFDRMTVIWATDPTAALAVWSADQFGVDGTFLVRLPDRTTITARIGRCAFCTDVTLRPACPTCGWAVEPIRPLLEWWSFPAVRAPTR